MGDRSQLGSYTLTLEGIISFIEQWDPQFIHTDSERHRTLVTYAGELLNQRAERVLVLSTSIYIQTPTKLN